MRKSIAKTALTRIGAGVVVLVLVSTLSTYWLVKNAFEAKKLEELNTYISARVEKESLPFLTIQALEKQAGDLLKRALEQNDPDPESRFDALFPAHGDGTRRSRPELFDGMFLNDQRYIYGFGAFVGQANRLDVEAKNTLLSAMEIVRAFGMANQKLFASFYFFTPNDQLLIFAPNRADRLEFYRENAPGDFSFRDQQINQVTLPQNNPDRIMRCTGLQPILYDQSRQTWTTGCHTPVDVAGQHIGAFGTSFLLTDLFQNIVSNHLDGAYNMIITQDGQLIAHPTLLGDDAPNQRLLDIRGSQNEELIQIWDVVSRAHKESVAVTNDVTGDNIIATGMIPGPNWHFVTVFPRQQLADEAASIAMDIVSIGFIAIALMLAILWRITQKSLSQPLRELAESAVALKQANFTGTRDIIASLPTVREDEIGTLARAMGAMAEQLDQLVSGLEDEVERRTRNMQKALHRAREADESKSKLIGMVSHDIRSPLTVILGMVEIIRLQDLSEEVENRLKTIEKAGSRLLELANDILDYGRLEAGQVELSQKPFSLQDILDEARTATEIKATQKRLEFAYTQSPDALPHLIGDARRIAQILSNLLGNAVKYTDQGCITLDARAETTESGSCNVKILIKDTGVGIPENRHQAIFDPFAQEDTMDQNQTGGVGLGLSIVKDLIALMGGELHLQSQVGKGSTFTVELKLPEVPRSEAT